MTETEHSEQTTSELQKVADANQGSEGSSSFRRCVDCMSQISEEAKKCHVCHSFQHKGRHFLSLAPALSLLVAILALAPTTVSVIGKAISEKEPRYSVLTFYADNIAGPNGHILNPLDFAINAQITNLSEETLIVDDSLSCQTRKGVWKAPSEISSSEDGLPMALAGDRSGFALYFENAEKQLIPAKSTQTISWQVTDDQFVELNTWSTWQTVGLTKFAARDLGAFYQAIINEFELSRSSAGEREFPRGANFDGESLASFFLNLDCDISLENSYSEVSEELHLEFVVEYSGDGGNYPTWQIGKNIGGGFGNGPGGSNGDG
ncbi:hypothetical protein [Roseobacter sp. N2S]|uniref:hypothetical protein n=1 Tax=Roseobacter sp. N2S TaxID=2663844 RepID=UPI00285F2D02|nr:hypothetical protein [Roseobacter sp. N2S]MDR6265299.1 hypothetical protein [Roseobacter sp. N2S]